MENKADAIRAAVERLREQGRLKKRPETSGPRQEDPPPPRPPRRVRQVRSDVRTAIEKTGLPPTKQETMRTIVARVVQERYPTIQERIIDLEQETYITLIAELTETLEKLTEDNEGLAEFRIARAFETAFSVPTKTQGRAMAGTLIARWKKEDPAETERAKIVLWIYKALPTVMP